MPFHSPQNNNVNVIRNVLACRNTHRNDVTDFMCEFHMKPANQPMTKIFVNMHKDFATNLKTKLIGVLAGIANSCKNQCKHYRCDPTCVTNKNMSHSEIKQSNHVKGKGT